MTIRALITGTLRKAPETKSSATGTEYAKVTIRTTQKVRDGSTETVFVSAIAFNDQARQTLAALEVGDDVAMGGTLTVGIWTANDGATKPQINLIADTVAATRAMKRTRSGPSTRRRPIAPHENHDPDPFNDPLTF